LSCDKGVTGGKEVHGAPAAFWKSSEQRLVQK